QGVARRGVTGDSVSGDSRDGRTALQAHGGWEVLALSAVIGCWLEPAPRDGPQEVRGGLPRRAVRLAPDAPQACTGAAGTARRPRAGWRRLSVGSGTQGPRIADWPRVRVLESCDGFPGPDVWLLGQGSDRASG